MERRYAIGNYIYERRREKGYTQKELAELLGVTDKAVSKWETGAALPRLDTMRRLAEILGCPLEELLLGGSIKTQSAAEEPKAEAEAAVSSPAQDRPAARAMTAAELEAAYAAERATLQAVKSFKLYKKIALIAGLIAAVYALLYNLLYIFISEHIRSNALMNLWFLSDRIRPQLLIFGFGNIALSTVLLLLDVEQRELRKAKTADLTVGAFIAAAITIVTVVQAMN